jgi:hypothetical protein
VLSWVGVGITHSSDRFSEAIREVYAVFLG